MKTVQKKAEGEKKLKYVALFGYPMDSSVRPQAFANKAEIKEYARKWEHICYFIVAFKSTDYFMEL